MELSQYSEWAKVRTCGVVSIQWTDQSQGSLSFLNTVVGGQEVSPIRWGQEKAKGVVDGSKKLICLHRSLGIILLRQRLMGEGTINSLGQWDIGWRNNTSECTGSLRGQEQ